MKATDTNQGAQAMRNVQYKVELANKIKGGRAIGNLYGVARYVDGCRGSYELQPQEDEQYARDFCRMANDIARIGAKAADRLTRHQPRGL